MALVMKYVASYSQRSILAICITTKDILPTLNTSKTKCISLKVGVSTGGKAFKGILVHSVALIFMA